MKELLVIKIGGQVIDDTPTLQRVLKEVAALSTPFILVHGGGKLTTQLCERLGIETRMIDGRRITDAETLNVATMVYGGLINKLLVAQLQARGKNAIGVTGADNNLLLAKKREHPSIEFGFVGDVIAVNVAGFHSLLESGVVPVMAPLTHDGKGQLLNTNADTMAQSIATALSASYKTTLLFGFEKAGVLRDVTDEGTLITHIRETEYQTLKESGVVQAGMIPKLDNAFAAIRSGVARVIVGKADRLTDLLNGTTGTTLTHE